MSVQNGNCDFCGKGDGRLLETGDERSIAFYEDGVYVLWDGICKVGSGAYFTDFSTEELMDLIARSKQALKEHPMSFDDNQDIAMKKIWVTDEVDRGMQELLYRVEAVAEGMNNEDTPGTPGG